MHSDPTNQGDPVQWQRVEKPDFGYAAHVPPDWEEYPPNLKNSPFETARFADPADRRQVRCRGLRCGSQVQVGL
jgi:hypothetical protein